MLEGERERQMDKRQTDRPSYASLRVNPSIERSEVVQLETPAAQSETCRLSRRKQGRRCEVASEYPFFGAIRRQIGF
jgi:hypothetical protein